MGSPYQSPLPTDIQKFSYQFMSTDDKSQQEITQASIQNSSAKSDLKLQPQYNSKSQASKNNQNSVIIRKTVGELKRDQLSVLYFDNNLIKSAGPRISYGSNFEVQKNLCIDKTKGLENNNNNGRNVMTSNYQQFIQKSEANPNSLSKTFEKESQIRKLKVPKFSDSDKDLNQKFSLNQLKRDELLKEQLDTEELKIESLSNNSQQSSDDDLERQSLSNQALSIENLIVKNSQRKIVIQKNKVNFQKASSSDEIGVQDLDDAKLQESNQTNKNPRIIQFQDLLQTSQNSSGYRARKSMLNPDQSKLEFESLLQSSQLGNFSQSPECLRRQRSDNLIGIQQSIKNYTSLNHERSQNHLSLHTSNKLEVPKVLKAIPNTGFNELLKSPTTTTYQSQMKETEKIIQNTLSKDMNLTQQQSLNKSRQSNIFQMRRSQTYLKDKAAQLTQKLDQQKQERQQKNSPQKKINQQFGIKQQKEASRVSQSLLLDDYFSKSKERQTNTQNQNVQQNDNTKSNQNETLNITKENLKQQPNINTDVQQQNLQINNEFINQIDFSSNSSRLNKQAALSSYFTSNRKNSLSQSLNRLIDEQRCNSPIRVSQYLVDIDYMKALAEERLLKPTLNSSRDIRQNSNGGPIEVYVPENSFNFINNNQSSRLSNQSQSINQSNSNNAILSLSQVTKEKFKEVIDNLYVPTASVFKKKTKEREFRRPTQNPLRRSKSQQRNRDGIQQSQVESNNQKQSALSRMQQQIVDKTLKRDMIEDKIRDQYQQKQLQIKTDNSNSKIQSISTALSLSDIENNPVNTMLLK